MAGCKSLTVYLGGSFGTVQNRSLDKDTYDSFQRTQNKLQELGLRVLSPCRGKNAEEYHPVSYTPNEIVDRDIWDINRSDFGLWVMPYESIGSSMEIAYAKLVRRIPVVLVTQNPAVINHYWIRGLVTYVCSTEQEALEYIYAWLL